MEPLHVMPPSLATDVFFDVTNAGYHHHHHLNHHHHHPHQYTSHPLAGQGGSFWSTHSRGDSREASASSTTSALAPVSPYQSKDKGDVTDGEVLELGGKDKGLNSDRGDKQVSGDKNENTSPESVEEWKTDNEDKPESSETADQDTLSSPKETQVAATLKWLSENYELSEGVCLPRCVLYVHYLDFCKRQGFKPAGAATFGKLIRQKFKNITTRRLGTRGQSKYHYYGIGIKESSIYYQSVYTGKGLTRFSGIKIKTEGSCRKYSLSSKTGTLLPEFPNAYNLILPDQEAEDKMHTFIMMYRTHSQRILDTVITANFEEIQNLLIHFWQGYPQHLQDVLRLPVTCDVVAICDSILYKVLIDVLIPNAIQDLPESLSSDLRSFLKSLPHWLENSLDDLVPDRVRKIKLEVLHQFLRSMSRQLAFIKMAQTARPQLATSDVTTKALNDVELIDFEQMCVQASFALSDDRLTRNDKARDVFDELKNLLRKQAQVESYTEWIDSLIDKCVLQNNDSYPSKFQHKAGRFLLQWTMFGALVMKDLTLNGARSFSFLHLMKMAMDEYILLVMETQADKHRDELLQKNLQRHMKNAEEIKMSAKVRTQANKLQSSPKARKRKAEEHGDSGDEIDTTPAEESCQSYSAPPSSNYEPISGTAFSRPLPSNTLQRDSSEIDVQPATSSQCDSFRPPAINPNPLPLSPIKHFPSYDRPSYLPAFSFNTYSDYVNHTNSFAPPRQMQTFSDHASTQPFHPMSFNPAVNPAPPAPPSYWHDARPHHSTLGDPYSQLGYNNYSQTHDIYKKNSLLRCSMYQDGLSRPNPAFDGLSRANATLDGLARPNPSLDGLARPSPSFESSRPTMYYARPPENIQVGSSLTMGGYGNGFMEITPPSGQYPRQDGLLYQEDMFASNMAAASGLPGFTKSYLPTGFR